MQVCHSGCIRHKEIWGAWCYIDLGGTWGLLLLQYSAASIQCSSNRGNQTTLTSSVCQVVSSILSVNAPCALLSRGDNTGSTISCTPNKDHNWLNPISQSKTCAFRVSRSHKETASTGGESHNDSSWLCSTALVEMLRMRTQLQITVLTKQRLQ